jgi:hypothetical protein
VRSGYDLERRRAAREDESRPDESPRLRPGVDALLLLQRSAGNAAVAGMLSRVRDENQQEQEVNTDDPEELRRVLDLIAAGTWTAGDDEVEELQSVLRRLTAMDTDEQPRERKRKRGSAAAEPSRRSKRARRARGLHRTQEFYDAAWPAVKKHFEAASAGTHIEPPKRSRSRKKEEEKEDRTESTEAQLKLADGTLIPGTSGSASVHAESQAYDELWDATAAQDGRSREEAFENELHGAGITCGDGKPSCFMCSAIAHTLGVSVDVKDQRGYGQYNLPRIFTESESLLEELVGEEAITVYRGLSPMERGQVLRGLGSELYKAHKGFGKYFRL